MRPLQGRLEGGHSTASGRLPPPGRSRGSSRTVPRGAPAGTGPAQPPRRTPHRGGGSTTHARSSPLPPRNVYQPLLGRPGRSGPVNAVRGPKPARGEPDGPCTGGPELARRAVWMMETRSVSRSTAGAVADAIPPSCPHFRRALRLLKHQSGDGPAQRAGQSGRRRLRCTLARWWKAERFESLGARGLEMAAKAKRTREPQRRTLIARLSAPCGRFSVVTAWDRLKSWFAEHLPDTLRSLN